MLCKFTESSPALKAFPTNNLSMTSLWICEVLVPTYVPSASFPSVTSMVMDSGDRDGAKVTVVGEVVGADVAAVGVVTGEEVGVVVAHFSANCGQH